MSNKEKIIGTIFLILSLFVFCLTVCQYKEKISADMLGNLYEKTIINIEAPKKFIDDITVLTDTENLYSQNKFSLNSNFTETKETSSVIFSTGEISRRIKDFHLLIKKDKYNEFIDSCSFIFISVGNKSFYITPDRLSVNIYTEPRKSFKSYFRVDDRGLSNANKLLRNEYVEIDLADFVNAGNNHNIFAINGVGIFKALAIIFLSVFTNFFDYTISWIFLILGVLFLKQDKKFSIKKYEYVIIGLILVLNLILRLAFLSDTSILTADDQYSLDITSNSEAIKGLFKDPGNPPIYFIILKVWRLIFGQNITTAFILSVFIGVITIWTIYTVTKKHFGYVYGLIAAGIASVSAYILFYGRAIRVYGLAMLFTVLYMDAFIDLITNPNKKNILKYILITIVYINLHYYCVLITVLSFIFGIIYLILRNKKVKQFMYCNLVCSAALLPYILQTVIPSTLKDYFNTWIPYTTPSKMMEYLYGFFGNIPLTYLLITGLCFTAFYLCKRNMIETITDKQKILLIYCIYIILLIPVAIFTISQIKPVAIPKYFSIYYPLLIIFISAMPIWIPKIPYKNCFFAVFVLYFMSIQAANPYLINEDMHNMEVLLKHTNNTAIINNGIKQYPSVKKYTIAELYTYHFMEEKINNENETIYLYVHKNNYIDYPTKLTELGKRFNLQRIDIPNEFFYLYRLQRREDI